MLGFNLKNKPYEPKALIHEIPCRSLRILLFSIPFVGAFIVSSTAYASVVLNGSSNNMDYQVSLVAEHLSVPWGGIAFITRQKLFITQRHGEAVILDISNNSQTAVQGLPDVAISGQEGYSTLSPSRDTNSLMAGCISPTARRLKSRR